MIQRRWIMKKEILIIGSLNMDMVVRMKDMPLVGETVLGNDLNYIPGGKGANQACASGKLGGEVTMLGCVGDDNFGSILIDNLTNHGVDTTYIKRSKEQPTGTAVIYVNNEGNNSIVVIQGANKCCDIEYLKKNDFLFEKCDYVMLQMEIPYDAVFYAIKRAKELGKTVILNPAPAPDKLPDDIWDKIDYLTPNETELMKLSGCQGISIDAVNKSTDILMKRGVKNVLVTLGERGAMLATIDEKTLFPARKVTPVDTTAAGDCFNGAFTVGLAESMSESEAIAFANLASSIAVTRKGAQSSLPNRTEITK
jgi:ribokinase